MLAFAYHASIVLLIAVPFILAITRRHDDLAEFMALFAFALLVVVVVSTPFPASVVLNAAMIASTPTQGGYYLADVIAGIASDLTGWAAGSFARVRSLPLSSALSQRFPRR
ncbi:MULTISPECIES: hypothetical protein [Burkholderia]|uniref:hypothetical protein n=1 Tax=Burkholderia TaxID=32008 RepID=UPI001627E2D9|nr:MULTISPECIES: hypothetical protein [Burkholderia]